MKKILLALVSVLFFIGCKQEPSKPTRAELVRKSFEPELVKGLDDPSSYEFDTIYCVYNYTYKSQLEYIIDDFKKDIKSYQYSLKQKDFSGYMTAKDYQNSILEKQHALHEIDSCIKSLPQKVLTDTIGYCYVYKLRASNSFGAKVKGTLYLYADSTNKVKNLFQVNDDETPVVRPGMVFPILEDKRFDFLNKYIYETGDNHNEFLRLLNIDDFER